MNSIQSDNCFVSVGGNTDNKFTIDATTGWISASNLDYETLSTYTLVIAAKDLNGANGAHETTVNVEVSVVTGKYNVYLHCQIWYNTTYYIMAYFISL